MRAITIIGLAALLLAQGAAAAVQDEDQRECLVGYEKQIARVAKKVGRQTESCWSASAKRGDDFIGCLFADTQGKVGKAKEKAAKTEARLCGERRSDFGTTTTSLATSRMENERIRMLVTLFGSPIQEPLPSGEKAARCQTTALRGADEVTDAHWQAAVKAAKRASKREEGVVGFERAIEDKLLSSTKLAKGRARTAKQIDDRCEGLAASALSGSCEPGEAGACVAAAGACQFCRVWNAATGAVFDCDLYDNAIDDDSCPTAGGVLYVSPTGSDTNVGSPEAPLATLDEALDRAQAEGGNRVRMAAGTYRSAGHTVREGISIAGGFDPSTWAPGAGPTVISSSETTGFIARDVADATELADLTIESASGADGASSYAVLASSSDGLRLRNTILRPGDGGDGEHGNDGREGNDGDDGSDGKSCTGGGCFPDVIRGGSGGNGRCAGEGGFGGSGGLAPTPGIQDGTGAKGVGIGDAAGGTGGAGCFAVLPTSCTPGNGERGEDGEGGAPFATPAEGGSAPAGHAASSGWSGESGSRGRSGRAGGGGAGGGGGGGRQIAPFITDNGAGGGGGGEPGCGGTPGSGGDAGGGSFGLYAYDSDVTLENVTALAGRGGAGGDGGDGGMGGDGGTGGDGGSSAGGGEGGDGGDGGDGGRGQAGGGGSGGASFGIFAGGDSSLTELGTNDFQAEAGGPGGSPGAADGASGEFGSAP